MNKLLKDTTKDQKEVTSKTHLKISKDLAIQASIIVVMIAILFLFVMVL